MTAASVGLKYFDRLMPLLERLHDIGAGRDRAVVHLGRNRQASDHPEHGLRLHFIPITPHDKRGKAGGGTAGPRSDGVLRIAANLLDAPAEVIGFIYHQRWMSDASTPPGGSGSAGA